MSRLDQHVPFSAEEASFLVEMAERAVSAQDLPELADSFLGGMTAVLGAPAACLYLGDARLPQSTFFHAGLSLELANLVKKWCMEKFPQLSHSLDLPPETIFLSPTQTAWVNFYPLQRKMKHLGLLGLVTDKEMTTEPALLKRGLFFLTSGVGNLLDRFEHEKHINNLNTYLNVSSMIAQALDLRDVLEAVLYFCMESLHAEAASVLLLDYAKENFRFYSAEGEAKQVLLMATFPANQGLAGAVLESQQSEIINDVQNDPRFYGKFDQDSGFFTRNMIVLPLTAGDEKIGILEVLNKMGGEPFREEELVFLQSIAEEIAFAIRNGKLFEVVVKSYCKQRQGLNTCKGCKRPLGSWTPCVKYREEGGLLM